jgi:uncharacterized alpha-E superfamily protein
VLSRVADAIYWMNRYVERAENVARFVDVSLHLSLDFPETPGQWSPLVATTGDSELFAERFKDSSRENVLGFLTFDRECPNSILSCFAKARENARSVREIISSEMWEQVNRAYLMVMEASRAKTALDAPHEFFSAVKQASHLFVGTSYLTMSHNEAWHFGRLGRLLERADKTSRIVDVKYFFLLPRAVDVGTTVDELQWAAVLRSASAFEMYRKQYGSIAPTKVVEFLVLSRRFPRSVRYCLGKAERSLHAITGTDTETWGTPAERELGRLVASVTSSDVEGILSRGLHETIDEMQTHMNEVGAAVQQTFFAMKPSDAGRTHGAERERASLPPPSKASQGQGQ